MAHCVEGLVVKDSSGLRVEVEPQLELSLRQRSTGQPRLGAKIRLGQLVALLLLLGCADKYFSPGPVRRIRNQSAQCGYWSVSKERQSSYRPESYCALGTFRASTIRAEY